MPDARPTTVPAYIDAAPAAARPHLRKLRALLRKAAPKATETIKWNAPFYVEPLPVDLIRRMAAHRVAAVAARSDDSFW